MRRHHIRAGFARPVIAAIAFGVAATASIPATADVITVTVPGCVVDPGDVIGWWKGEDDLAAQIGPDLVGSVDFADGFFERAMSFTGSSVAQATGLGAPTTAVTVQAWIKPIQTGRAQALIGRWDFPSTDDSARSYLLWIDGGGRLVWTTDETSTRRPEELAVTVPTLFDGLFHHVAATWDSSQFALYFDGVPVGSRPSQGGVLNPAPTVPFRLGAKSGFGSAWLFQGVLDEPMVLNRALSAAEVDEVVAAGPNAVCVVVGTNGLVGPGLQIPGDVGGVDPVVSPDGRYVLFRSRSTNQFPIVNDPLLQTPGVDLDLFDNYRDDLILLDRQGTPTTSDDTYELVSVDSAELGGRLDSAWGAMTPDAGRIAFASISNDLVPGDTLSGRDLFLRDRVAGTTQRVSVRSDGSQPQYTATGLNNDSRAPSVNDTGTMIAFESTNRDLAPEAFPVPGDTWQTYDIYVRDISDPNPLAHVTERLTVGVGGVKADGSSSTPIVSPDGRYVWFTSLATNLVAGDTNGVADLFVHDRQTDVTTRLDVTTGTGSPLNSDVYLADVSPDGRWVTFSTSASTVVSGDTNAQFDAFVLDTQTSTVVKVSPPLPAPGNGASFAGPVSADGRYVVFTSTATNLVPGDTNGRQDVFIADVVNDTVQRISLGLNGEQRDGTSGYPVASADTRAVVYTFQATGSGIFTIWQADLLLP